MQISRRAVLGAATVVALSACGSGRGDTSSTTSASGSGGAGGFAAGSTIGVSLPWLGTQNWKEAQDMFTAQLTAAGFKPMVQSADNKATQQQQQINAMVQQGAKVIVVGAVDGTQLATVLKNAKDSGVKIIAYDRAITSDAVTALVQFGAIKTGQLQGQSLLDGLKARKGNGPYNIELFGGSPDDPNAPLFFQGAMQVLQPKIDDKTLNIVSGQKSFSQCAIQGWSNQTAQTRMSTLLAGNYAGKKLDGALSPNDGIARAILTAASQANQGVPVVDGLDAEDESIVSIWKGIQWSTTAKPTDKLVAQAIEVIKAMQGGTALPSAQATEGTVSEYQLDPTVLTKDKLKEFYANNPAKLKLLA